ncbi:hypothetical protein G6724_00055 [Polynucleobacter paneuropaeus]|nr:hypothetical protein [Polynucleobacter paneuropaeus]
MNVIPNSAALIVYSNDEDMLRLQFDMGQFDLYEKIYIFDGPYNYVKNIFPFLDPNASRLSEKSDWKSILSDSRIIYDYRAYENEFHKRTFAYDVIIQNNIFLHDTDEFLEWDFDVLKEFIDGDKAVASFRCQNLYGGGFQLVKSHLVDENSLPWKPFAFKKNIVNSSDHIDHLWLVGVKQKEKNSSLVFRKPIATGYHLTQMRSTVGQLQKYSFYSSLHAINTPLNTHLIKALKELDEGVSQGKISDRDALLIYLSSIAAFSFVPNHDQDYFFQKRFELSEYLEGVVGIAANFRHRSKAGDFKILGGMPYLFFVESCEHRKVVIGNHGKISLKVKIFSYKLGIPGALLIDSFDTSSDVVYILPESFISIGYLFQIYAAENSTESLIPLTLNLE